MTETRQCLDKHAIHVNWLKAGHEVIQERTPFLLGLLSNLAKLCGLKEEMTLGQFEHDEAISAKHADKTAADREESLDIFALLEKKEAEKKRLAAEDEETRIHEMEEALIREEEEALQREQEEEEERSAELAEELWGGEEYQGVEGDEDEVRRGDEEMG